MATIRDMINTNYSPYSNPLGGTGASMGGGYTSDGRSYVARPQGTGKLPNYGNSILGTFLKMIEYLKPESIGRDKKSSGIGNGTTGSSKTASEMGLTNTQQAQSEWGGMGYANKAPKTGGGDTNSSTAGNWGRLDTQSASVDAYNAARKTADATKNAAKKSDIDTYNDEVLRGIKPQAATNLPAGSIGQQIYSQTPAGTSPPVVTGGTQATPAVTPAATVTQPDMGANAAASLGAMYDPITGKWNWEKLKEEYGTGGEDTGDTGGE